MPHGYGFFTFGWKQAERDAARLGRFNERWQRLTKTHASIIDDFVTPLDSVIDRMTALEHARLVDCTSAMWDWYHTINNSVNDARPNHLSHYATSIKKTAMKALSLCKKYDVRDDIASHAYDAARKMIVLNGQDRFYLG